MRLVSFTHGTTGAALQIGAHIAADNTVVNFSVSLPGCPPTMKGFLEGGEAFLAAAAAIVASPDAVRYPLEEVTLKVRPLSFQPGIYGVSWVWTPWS